MSTLELAIAIAAEAHAGQSDRGGAPYILHPLGVMLRMGNDTDWIVAVLHNVLEDCPGGALRGSGQAASRKRRPAAMLSVPLIAALSRLAEHPCHAPKHGAGASWRGAADASCYSDQND